MKFLESEHEAFKEVVSRTDLDYSSLRFVKRKGWLHISHPQIESTFRFHRKDTKTLNDAGKWTEDHQYLASTEKDEFRSSNFKIILEHFKLWLGDQLE